MAEMVVDGVLLRAMSIIGGRCLLKSAETLAAGIVRLNTGSKAQCNGKEIRIMLGSDKAIITAQPKAPVLQDDYYAFQK